MTSPSKPKDKEQPLNDNKMTDENENKKDNSKAKRPSTVKKKSDVEGATTKKSKNEEGGCCGKRKSSTSGDSTKKKCCSCCDKKKCCNSMCIVCWIVFIIGICFALALIFDECRGLTYSFKLFQKRVKACVLLSYSFIALVLLICMMFAVLIKCNLTKKIWKPIAIVMVITHLLVGTGTGSFLYHIKRKFVVVPNQILSLSTVECIRKCIIYVLVLLVLGVIPFIVFMLEYRKNLKEVHPASSDPQSQQPAAEVPRGRPHSSSNLNRTKSTTSTVGPQKDGPGHNFPSNHNEASRNTSHRIMRRDYSVQPERSRSSSPTVFVNVFSFR